MAKSADDPKCYDRKPISNYEGFKRLDKSLETLELRDKAHEKVCDICNRRCRAWRIVPATFGKPIGRTKAGLSGGLKGKFVVACDANRDGCAAFLERSGVVKEALREQEAFARLEGLGLVLS